MKLVLDTNALWSVPLFDALAEARVAATSGLTQVQAIVPAVAYAERYRQMRQRPRGTELLATALERGGVHIEAFGPEQVHRLPAGVADGQAWTAHGRDFLIAAHVHGDRVAVTEDRGPAWEAIPSLLPSEAAQAVRALIG